MNNGRVTFPGKLISFGLLLFGMLSAFAVQAGDFTLNVVDGNGNPVSGFRWMLQEDTTFHPDPGVAGDPDILSFTFHKSYHPPARHITGEPVQGFNDTDSTGLVSNVADGNYYVSVLPYEGYSIGGAPLTISGDSPTVTVTVQQHPIPTTQISIYLFHDKFNINGAPDLPEEQDLGETILDENELPIPNPDHVDWTQFSLFLEEPAGRYGMAGGQVIQDAFGNPLGTTYQKTCDENGANPGSGAYGCFDVNGDPIILVEGDGTLQANQFGYIHVENIPPGKYGVVIIPPTGQNWQQTSTIEGSPVIDAWVKAKEPQFFVEFGPPGPHVFVGFVRANEDYDPLDPVGGFGGLPISAGGDTITGRIMDTHLSRPTATDFFNGRTFPDCWVGLNQAAGGPALFAGPCADDSTFSIANVPAGSYSLAIFDKNLDAIIAQAALTVNGDGTCNALPDCNLGDVGIFNWFTRLNTGIFKDDNMNGFWDAGEIGIGPESQDVSLRWRDGTMYQNFPTDNEGLAPFDEVFPFFHWLVAEVSFGNKKATGATFVVDAGGEVLADNGWTLPSFDELTPQAQCIEDLSSPLPGATVGYLPGGVCPPGDEDINPNTGNNLSRTETGQVLTAGTQGFQGQTSVMHFGKTDYVGFDFTNFPTDPMTFVGENGGISGIVFNTTTRAEDDPSFAAAEEWEPGVPRVQVNLYVDGDINSFPLDDFPGGPGDIDWNGNGIFDADDNAIDDIDNDAVVTLADVDNYPLGFSECTDKDGDDNGDAGCISAVGPEDIDRDGDGLFDYGDALQVTWTDSWDDSLPTGCQGETFDKFGDPLLPTDCYDGLRNFNQIRPAVFDGGYAFTDYDLDRLASANPAAETAIQNFYSHINTTLTTKGYAYVAELQLGLLPGDYIVEAAAPTGYDHIAEQDRNVDFGDDYIPAPQALPVACVGDSFTVPPLFSMLTKNGSGELCQAGEPCGGSTDNVIADAHLDPGNAAPFAGETRLRCDRKKVPLSTAQNAAAEFFLKTNVNVPLAANTSGITLNDLANEFDPNSPAFSEKYAPPWIPVAFYDWNGGEVNRVYGDEYGRFNAMLASTFTANIGMPSGMSPNMIQSCMNDAGPIPDGNGGLMIDPNYDPQYSQFCYTFQYMPGTITYLDTPVVSIAAFAGNGGYPVDCERPHTTPMIESVTSIATNAGPYLVGGPGSMDQEIRITSMGLTEVSNPEWDGTPGDSRTVMRDYGFGASQGNGKVELIDAAGTATVLGISDWQDGYIDAVVPAGFAVGEYHVRVTANYVPPPTNPTLVNPLIESPYGVTLTVGDGTENVIVVGPNTTGPLATDDFATIQEAIDAASGGDLILVKPGTYDEMVIMYKPVKLQGWGMGSVFINARPIPTDKLADWNSKILTLITNEELSMLPGQEAAQFGFAGLTGGAFQTEQGSGILVAGCDSQVLPTCDSFDASPGARIDGISILAASQGGGIVVNGYAQDLQISNNRLTGNAGILGGAIRVGNPLVNHAVVDINDPAYDPAANGGTGNVGDLAYDDAVNDNITIRYNHIDKNGATSASGAGAGISLHSGAHGYQVRDNWICGNFTQSNGAGIAHLGLSDGGLIEDNFVLFNESFQQGGPAHGGGIFIGGQAGLEPWSGDETLVLSPGSGSVTVDANQIRGNLAGAGDGGGISIVSVNGDDIGNSLGDTAPWYEIDVFNNMINNNVSGLAGGGIAVQDALKVNIRNNTVANNDSVATANAAFDVLPPTRSVEQPAGIAAREHSATMSNLVNLHVLGAAGLDPDWFYFSEPVLQDDIIFHNRSFYWANVDDPGTTIIETGLFPASCVDPTNTADPECDVSTATLNAYADDLGVMNGVFESAIYELNAFFSMLTDHTVEGGGMMPAYNANISGLPGNDDFYNGYFNTDRRATLLFAEPKAAATAGAFDEGGNFLQVSYGPLSVHEPGTGFQGLFGYHLDINSNAINGGGYAGGEPRLDVDIDNDVRFPSAAIPDIGADLAVAVVPLDVDSDGDGVDDTLDNCITVANADQRDTDGDGYGNMCDADLNNDGSVNVGDLVLFKARFATTDADADLNGDGTVNVGDLVQFKALFANPPGPSALAP